MFSGKRPESLEESVHHEETDNNVYLTADETKHVIKVKRLNTDFYGNREKLEEI